MPMSPEQAAKEMVKVAAAFKMLESGRISTMSEADFQAFKEWLN